MFLELPFMSDFGERHLLLVTDRSSPGMVVMKRCSGPPIDPDNLRALLIALVTVGLVAWAIWEFAR